MRDAKDIGEHKPISQEEMDYMIKHGQPKLVTRDKPYALQYAERMKGKSYGKQQDISRDEESGKDA